MIEKVNHLSFLGILIDDKCNWNYHINYIRAKLSRSIAIINKKTIFKKSYTNIS